MMQFSGLHTSQSLRFSTTPCNQESHDYIGSLYTKLSHQEEYSFLDPNISSQQSIMQDTKLISSPEFKSFLNILANAESETSDDNIDDIERQFCDKFQEWSKVAQLRVGFLMYVDKRISSSDYLSKVIKYICSSYHVNELESHSLIALLLLIYFKRDLTVDDLSEYLDLEQLQRSLAIKMENKKMTQEEVCAACLGLKRIGNFKINNQYLRKSLYNNLSRYEPSQGPLDDFYLITLMTTLSKGNLLFLDDPTIVNNTLNNISNNLSSLSMATKIKLLTFPLSLGFSNSTIKKNVFSDLDLSSLETWDLVQLCSFVSKQHELQYPVSDIVEYLDTKLDNINNRDELMDVIECYHYLSQINAFSIKFNKLIFSEINQLPSHMFRHHSDLAIIAESVSSSLMKKLNIASDEAREKQTKRNDNKTVSFFTRLPAFISSCYRLESGGEECVMEKKRSHFISQCQHRTLPRELMVPQMKVRHLELI